MESRGIIQFSDQADIPELVLLVNSAYRGESSKKGWTTEADLLGGARISVDALSLIMDKPGSAILKYFDEENSILGCVHLQKEDSRLYLGMLSVKPELQAQGIGKRLLKAAMEYGKSIHCSSIYITVL